MDLEGETDRYMTPKQKAEELVDNFYNTEHCHKKHFPNNKWCDCSEMNMLQAKQCAKLAAAEIISQWEYIDTYLADGRGELNPNLKYWKEVKEELDKL